MNLHQESVDINAKDPAQVVRCLFEAIRDESKARNLYSALISGIECLKTTTEMQAEWASLPGEDDEERKELQKKIRKQNRERDALIVLLKQDIMPALQEILEDENNHIGKLLAAVQKVCPTTNEQIIAGVDGK